MELIEQELLATLRGEPALQANDERLPALLAQVRSAVGSTRDQQALGRFSLSLITARLKASIATERAIGNARGPQEGE